MNKERLARLAQVGWPYAVLGLAAATLVALRARGGIWPMTHEHLRYPALVEHFTQAFLHGQGWPRWLPEINGGRGYPTFVFYQPLLFFLALPFRLLTGNPVDGLWAATALLLGLGAIGCYRLCVAAGSRVFGLFAGLLFLFTPYLAVNWLVRGDLSELAAMCFVPWALGFLRSALGRWHSGAPTFPALVGLAVAASAVLLAHPITGILLAPSLVVVAVFGVEQPRRDWPLLARIAVAGAAAVALLTPYWQPLVSLRGSVNIAVAFDGYFRPELHTVHWHQLFGGPWAFAGSAAGSPLDNMSFELGNLQLLAALTGVAVGWSNRFVRGVGVALLLSVAAMTPTFAFVWKWPLLSQMQFPWRMLSVITGLEVAAASGWGVWLLRTRVAPSGGRLALVLALALLAAGWRPEQFTLAERDRTPRRNVAQLVANAPNHPGNFAAMNEFLPKTAPQPLAPRGAAPLVEVPEGVQVRPRPGHGAHRIAVELEATRSFEAVINQLYFPGWSVEVDGRAVPRQTLEARLGEDGRIRVPIDPAAGSSQVLRARYAGPPGAPIRWGAVLLGVGLLILLARFDRRRATVSSENRLRLAAAGAR